jgi:hypothetical protein
MHSGKKETVGAGDLLSWTILPKKGPDAVGRFYRYYIH